MSLSGLRFVVSLSCLCLGFVFVLVFSLSTLLFSSLTFPYLPFSSLLMSCLVLLSCPFLILSCLVFVSSSGSFEIIFRRLGGLLGSVLVI